MHSAIYVDNLITDLKNKGIPLSSVAWNAALACAGMPYIFGNRGQYCTPSNRRAAYDRTAAGKNKDNIKNRCKNFDGSGSCSGCKWLPLGEKVRSWDCRGFTYWIILQVYGFKIMGAGATSQWNNANNWKAKGKIADGFPKDTLVCLFYSKDGKEKTWEHTGLGFNNETVECSNGVQYSATRNKKWTHWAVPKCVETEDLIIIDGGKEEPDVILKNGSRGQAVKELQQMLNEAGFDCGKADGIFGQKTEFAVCAFQAKVGLAVDGKAGPQTIEALKSYQKQDTPPAPDTGSDLDIAAIKASINRIEKELSVLKSLIGW